LFIVVGGPWSTLIEIEVGIKNKKNKKKEKENSKNHSLKKSLEASLQFIL
jgi:hypothetical protein